ncbi:MAG: alpha/beta fold hydrolase [Candidatus Melainabacteria bacterium]|nr:alpha/beta fold hydrolase [Candidatus Melainabacteria bacterium]
MTRKTLLYKEQNFSLTHFEWDQQSEYVVPVLLVPSIMVSSKVFDLTDSHNFVKYLLENGFSVYSVDFNNPSRSDAKLRLDDYVLDFLYRSIHMTRKHSGAKQISLLGYCLGGTFSLAYASMSHRAKNDIKNVINIAGPVGGKDIKFFNYIFKPFKNRWFAYTEEYGFLPGNTIKFLFKVSNPLLSLKRFFYLFKLFNKEYRERYKAVSDLFRNMKNIPEVAFKQCFEILENNTLVDGKLILMDQNVKLSNLEASLLNIAGTQDEFIPKQSVEILGKHIVSDDYEFKEFPFGHLSILASSKAKETIWKECANWLKKRSRNFSYKLQHEQVVAK